MDVHCNSSNYNPGFSDEDIHYRISYMLQIPLAILIFALNIPAIIMIVTNRKLHFPNFYLLLSLGFADVMIGLLLLIKAFIPKPPTYTACLLEFMFVTLPVCASVITIFWVGLDRYIAVKSPLTYRFKMTRKRCAVCITATWSYSTVVALLILIWNTGDECVRCSYAYVIAPGYMWFILITVIIIPLTANVCMYAAIFQVARKHNKSMRKTEKSLGLHTRGRSNSTCALHNGNHEASQPRKLSLAQKHFTPSFLRTMKAVKSLLFILGGFLISWGPFVVVNITQLLCSSCDLKDIIGTYLLLLGYCNSVINPLVYIFTNNSTRTALLGKSKIWCKKVCCFINDKEQHNLVKRQSSSTDSDIEQKAEEIVIPDIPTFMLISAQSRRLGRQVHNKAITHQTESLNSTDIQDSRSHVDSQDHSGDPSIQSDSVVDTPKSSSASSHQSIKNYSVVDTPKSSSAYSRRPRASSFGPSKFWRKTYHMEKYTSLKNSDSCKDIKQRSTSAPFC